METVKAIIIIILGFCFIWNITHLILSLKKLKADIHKPPYNILAQILQGKTLETVKKYTIYDPWWIVVCILLMFNPHYTISDIIKMIKKTWKKKPEENKSDQEFKFDGDMGGEDARPDTHTRRFMSAPEYDYSEMDKLVAVVEELMKPVPDMALEIISRTPSKERAVLLLKNQVEHWDCEIGANADDYYVYWKHVLYYVENNDIQPQELDPETYTKGFFGFEHDELHHMGINMPHIMYDTVKEPDGYPMHRSMEALVLTKMSGMDENNGVPTELKINQVKPLMVGCRELTYKLEKDEPIDLAPMSYDEEEDPIMESEDTGDSPDQTEPTVEEEPTGNTDAVSEETTNTSTSEESTAQPSEETTLAPPTPDNPVPPTPKKDPRFN